MENKLVSSLDVAAERIKAFREVAIDMGLDEAGLLRSVHQAAPEKTAEGAAGEKAATLTLQAGEFHRTVAINLSDAPEKAERELRLAADMLNDAYRFYVLGEMTAVRCLS